MLATMIRCSETTGLGKRPLTPDERANAPAKRRRQTDDDTRDLDAGIDPRVFAVFLARAAVGGMTKTLALMVADASEEHIEAALCHIIDKHRAVQRICDAVGTITDAHRILCLAATQDARRSIAAIVERACSTRDIVSALSTLVAAKDVDAVMAIVDACAAARREPQQPAQRFHRDALCEAARQTDPDVIAGLVSRCGETSAREALIHLADEPRAFEALWSRAGLCARDLVDAVGTASAAATFLRDAIASGCCNRCAITGRSTAPRPLVCAAGATAP
ncbi:hypothetical protein pkur_cds_731 [Pandoravirus kuranda]|uniref:Uncharacterized protein n=1 Tax=Pandoravirus kuranda TaxID=3019033 RepID=A0AA95EF91_9VIRU|nr:hypothetical protein pkur_cds_731 [Pandoravirus kuranda]